MRAGGRESSRDSSDSSLCASASRRHILGGGASERSRGDRRDKIRQPAGSRATGSQRLMTTPTSMKLLTLPRIIPTLTPIPHQQHPHVSSPKKPHIFPPALPTQQLPSRLVCALTVAARPAPQLGVSPGLGRLDDLVAPTASHQSAASEKRGADPVQPITISVSFLYLYLAICGSQLDLRAVLREM